MSAFIVCDGVIDTIVTYIYPDMKNRYGSENDLGQVLVDENYNSVNTRYKNHVTPHGYKFQRKDHKGLDVLRACQFYEYQACETEGYYLSEAATIIRWVMGKAIRNLDGYDVDVSKFTRN